MSHVQPVNYLCAFILHDLLADYGVAYCTVVIGDGIGTHMEACNSRKRINILIWLSSFVLSEAMQGLLNGDSGEYCTRLAVDFAAIQKFDPDEILVDAAVLTLRPHLCWPQAKLILIDTGLPANEVVSLLLNHQLAGIISTDTNSHLLRKALRAIINGEIWMDNSKLNALILNLNRNGTMPANGSLSKKEQEIVLLVAEGQKNKEIAERLSISEQTVKAHISRIFKKSNVTSRSQLVPIALALKASVSL